MSDGVRKEDSADGSEGVSNSKSERKSIASWFKKDPKTRCDELVVFNTVYSPFVKFMIEKLETAGCAVDSRVLRCVQCGPDESKCSSDESEPAEIAGGFNPYAGIVICQEHVTTKSHMERTLMHELVHMYDHCKAKVDWTNAKHHACTEIRAANLSGECGMLVEVLQSGSYDAMAKGAACVRRRALVSLNASPHFTSEQAEAAVDEVFDTCFNDSSPFDMLP
eukprot:CFRG5747T1